MMHIPGTNPQRFDPVRVGKAVVEHLERGGHGAVLGRADTQESDIARVRLRNLEGVAQAAKALKAFCNDLGYQSRLLNLDGKDEESGFGNAKALLGLILGNEDPKLEYVFGIAAGDSKALERIQPEDVRGLGQSVIAGEIVNLYAELSLLIGANRPKSSDDNPSN